MWLATVLAYFRYAERATRRRAAAVAVGNATATGFAIKAPIVGAIGTATYEYVRGMGEFADDIVFAEFLVSEDPLAHQKEFTDLFRKAYNNYPKAFDAAGWDAVHILARAAASASGPTSTGA